MPQQSRSRQLRRRIEHSAKVTTQIIAEIHLVAHLPIFARAFFPTSLSKISEDERSASFFCAGANIGHDHLQAPRIGNQGVPNFMKACCGACRAGTQWSFAAPQRHDCFRRYPLRSASAGWGRIEGGAIFPDDPCVAELP